MRRNSHDVLDVSELKHRIIHHSERFVEGKTDHINGVDTFLSKAKHRMRRFNTMPKDKVRLFFKEYGGSLNYLLTENLCKTLLNKWPKQDLTLILTWFF